MNTGRSHVDYAEAQRAMDFFDRAESMVQLSAGIDVLAAAVRLPNYLTLDMLGVQRQICNALHNLADIDIEAVAQSTLTARLLVRPIPVSLNREFGVDAFRFGVAVSAPRGNSTCLLFMGRSDAPLEDDSLVEIMGIASICATHLVDSLVRLGRKACPLSQRELQCLCLATNGLSAKETARRLGISHRTVEEYLANCRDRLNASTTLSAVLQALRKGWISFDDIEAANLSSISRQSGAG